jgi:hypothetical protein
MRVPRHAALAPGGRLGAALSVVAAVLLAATPAAAQPTDGAARQAAPLAPSPPTDFFMGRPIGLLAFRAGRLFANTGSDLFDFVTDQLTVSRNSFDAASLAGDVGVFVGPRVDVIATLEQARSETPSQYREFVDTAGAEITQTTRLQEWTVSGTVRVALVPRGRRISRFAWIPRALTPYVGAGGGAVRYEFQQYGAFVDFRTLRVFNDTFRSQGWAPTAHVLGGADLRLYRRLYLTTEARYTWSSATLGDDFVDFEPMTLGGTRISAGIQVVF